MKHVLVTGINGFVGHHLARALFETGCEVSGIGRETGTSARMKNIVKDWYPCDLADKSEVYELDLSPYDTIISLAGLASTGKSFDQPELYLRVNVAVLSNICDRLLGQKSKARVLAVSTGTVYDSSQPMPLTEESKITEQGSPYTLSKIAMEMAAKNCRARGLDCIIIRPFNHIGPGQGRGFLLPDLYAKIIDSAKTGNPVKVGNLQTKRDYTDVRDIVRAYTALAVADKLSIDLFNICSGISRSGQEVLTTLLSAMGLRDKVRIEQDPSLIRPNDPLELVGSYDRLYSATGWQPQTPFEQTITDFVASQLA